MKSKIKVVPLTEKTNSELDDIVKNRQKYSNHLVTKKGVVGDLIGKSYKKEIKNATISNNTKPS